jgi:hypothetical protein
MSFFKYLLSPFRRGRDESTEASRRTSQPGPFATGANIEAQTPARRRYFWSQNNDKRSDDTAPETKSDKPERGGKMGTISGVFIPTTLNVLSILMYLRVKPPTTIFPRPLCLHWLGH